MSSSIGKAQPQQPSGKPGKTAAKLEHEIYIQIHTVYQNIHILNAKVKNRPCNLALKRHRSQLQLLQVQRSFEVSNGAEIRKLQTFSRPATAKHRKERVVCKEKYILQQRCGWKPWLVPEKYPKIIIWIIGVCPRNYRGCLQSHWIGFRKD